MSFANILGELLGLMVYEAGRAAVREDSTSLEELTPEQQRVFTEVIVAAILFDGKRTELEEEWIAKRRAELPSLVDEAVGIATSSLPEGCGRDDYEDFVKHRKKALGSERTRERVFETSARFLLAGPKGRFEGPAWEMTRRFGRALGIDDVTIGDAIQRLHD
jgi:hypothetical protein